MLPVVRPAGGPGSELARPGPLVTARPALPVPADARRPRRSRRRGLLVAPLAVLLLLGAGGYVVSQAGGSLAMKPPAGDLPAQLRGDLRQLQQLVAK